MLATIGELQAKLTACRARRDIFKQPPKQEVSWRRASTRDVFFCSLAHTRLQAAKAKGTPSEDWSTSGAPAGHGGDTIASNAEHGASQLW